MHQTLPEQWLFSVHYMISTISVTDYVLKFPLRLCQRRYLQAYTPEQLVGQKFNKLRCRIFGMKSNVVLMLPRMEVILKWRGVLNNMCVVLYNNKRWILCGYYLLANKCLSQHSSCIIILHILVQINCNMRRLTRLHRLLYIWNMSAGPD